MSIKNLQPNKNSGFIQGYYNPKNPEKYIGPTPIIYRSSWERKFMIMCDNKDNVVKWSSEPVEIKYIWSFDKREHKYYPDFYMKTKTEDGFEEFLVEIKPEAQIKKPKRIRQRRNFDFITNVEVFLCLVLFSEKL